MGVQRRGSLAPLGLWYGYVDANPLLNTDPLGLLATSFCNRQQIEAIQHTEQQIRQSLGPLPPCLACDVDKVGRKLDTSTVHCLGYFDQGLAGVEAGACGAPKNPRGERTGVDVALTEDAFKPGCGCLTGTLLHEVLHLEACPKPDACARDNAKRCFPCHESQPR